MNFPFYIARRYLFSKKKHNAINIISGISVCGVALATLALVCTLSVFNGFQDMVASFFTAFDPQLKITIREGKVFDGQDEKIRAVCALPDVSVSTETLEENAMVQYKDRQAMVVLKGVEDNFEDLTEIDSILYGAGEFILHDSIVNYGVMGVELVSTLGTGLAFVDPLQVYLPKRNAKVNMANPGLLSIATIFIHRVLCSWSTNRSMMKAIFSLPLISFVTYWTIRQRFPALS